MNFKTIITLAAVSISQSLYAGTDYKQMVVVPAGEFTMGCKESDGILCAPGTEEHKVFVNSYKIDKYPVTFDRYQACIDDGSCTEPYYGAACNYQMAWSGNHPANCITFKQAESACAYEGKRLPTEAEWVKAARGPKANLFPWGNKPEPSCDRVVMSQRVGKNTIGPGCGAGTSQTVDSKPKGASYYGVMDMAGNVFEWTSDWYSENYFKQSPYKNPKGPATGLTKVLRGSAWTAKYRDGLALTVRFPYAPAGQGYIVGARCAQTANE